MRLELYIVIFLQIELAFGIRCYSCTGTSDKKQKATDPCVNPAENVDDKTVKEIECVNSKLCWKATVGGQLKRGCGGKRCAFIPDIDMGSLVSLTCCSNDLCNRTSSIKISKWTIYFLIFTIFFIK